MKKIVLITVAIAFITTSVSVASIITDTILGPVDITYVDTVVTAEAMEAAANTQYLGQMVVLSKNGKKMAYTAAAPAMTMEEVALQMDLHLLPLDF